MLPYDEFWKKQFNSILKKISPTQKLEYEITVDELPLLGDRVASGYDGKLITWIGNVQYAKDSAVFRSLRRYVSSVGQLVNKIPGELEISIKNNVILKVSYEPISYELLIERYDNISAEKKGREIYKWQLVKKYSEEWGKYENGEIRFKDFFLNAEFKNLIYPLGIAVLKHAARDKPDDFERLILAFYDEQNNLEERIEKFQADFKELYFSLEGHGANIYLEERTLATLLTFRYPEKYTFFKDSFYSVLCKGLGVKTERAGKKMIHYYQLIADFVSNHLIKHPGIIQKNKQLLDISCYPDPNNLILAQDILYLTLNTTDETAVPLAAEEEPPQYLSEDKKYEPMFPLNQILYGPPGTGKTYNSINRALEIAGEQTEGISRKVLKDIFDTKLREGQIIFTTFHQSMSYEDFIEGIKPLEPKKEGENISYKVIDGIFKKASALAAYNSYKMQNDASVRALKYSYDDLYEDFIGVVKNSIEEGKPPIFKTLMGKEIEIKNVNSNNSIIARSKNSIAGTSAPLTKENIQKLYDTFKTVEEIKDLQQVRDTVQVSPRTTEFYAVFSGLKAFEKTYKPDEELILQTDIPNYEEIQKKFNAGVFNDSIKKAGRSAKPVILIIDEINRGNISQIFGELITLIEEDKRYGTDEALEVILPYSKNKFTVPPNLYIIGTMNTADRSVEALDAALRRRFSFQEMPPQPQLISSEGKLSTSNGMLDEIDLTQLLIFINKRIEKLLDKDHLIGHSYFMEVDSWERLEVCFYTKVIPLLQEYFYGDFSKIGLVLGKGFVRVKQWSKADDSFADFDSESSKDYDDREVYEIIDHRTGAPYELKLKNDFVIEMTFKKSIKLLMKQVIE